MRVRFSEANIHLVEETCRGDKVTHCCQVEYASHLDVVFMSPGSTAPIFPIDCPVVAHHFATMPKSPICYGLPTYEQLTFALQILALGHTLFQAAFCICNKLRRLKAQKNQLPLPGTYSLNETGSHRLKYTHSLCPGIKFHLIWKMKKNGRHVFKFGCSSESWRFSIVIEPMEKQPIKAELKLDGESGSTKGSNWFTWPTKGYTDSVAFWRSGRYRRFVAASSAIDHVKE